jgi:hypothetical protein
MAVGAGRGGSASPASPWSGYSVQRKEKRAGRHCSPREEALGKLTGEGKAAVMEFDGGGGSGGAPVGGNQSSRHCTIPVVVSPDQQAPREEYDRVGERKDRAKKHFNEGVRRRGDAEAAVPVRWVLECV